MIIRGLGFITAQYAGLKRARVIAERENAGSSVAGAMGAYRQQLGEAEKLWPKLFRSSDSVTSSPISSIDDYNAEQIRNSLATRRRMLRSIDEGWFRRQKKVPFAFSDLTVTVPLLLAALILGWLGVGYWQISHAQQQAIEAFRDSLKGIITFALSYENTGIFGQDTFSKAVTQFETALLNPALPEADVSSERLSLGGGHNSVASLRQLISDCRERCVGEARARSSSDYPSPSDYPSLSSARYIIPSLRSEATQVLQSTYKDAGTTLWSYSRAHSAVLGAAALLILCAFRWRYFRELFRRIS
jgi:hypothetical protein